MDIIDYNNEPWLTDFIFGQKWARPHGHLTISGSLLLEQPGGQPVETWYLRDIDGQEIVKKGEVVRKSKESLAKNI